MKTITGIFVFLAAMLLWGVFAAGTAMAAPLADILRSRLSQEVHTEVSGDVEVLDIRVLQGGELLSADGNYRIGSVALDGYNGANRLNYRIELLETNKRSRSVLVEVVYESLVDVFITARALPKGAALSESDFYSVRHRASRLPVGAVMNKRGVLGKTLRINLSEGLVLKRDHFFIAGVVKRGQKVKVEIESGSVLIATRGILRTEGTVGSTVRVYCEASKKEILGVLVSVDKVRVKV
ncbi:MAG TPA: flagellar basal body P-ring formation chaperone FlgA [Dissulfurispiraceae bacterium]|nr:flagellar basal body P-ring formation chaperone FlgA [Dissulfurispiraceae bacterium]